ncbi:MAG: hypothetical protein AAFP03_03380 [Cyanobacteria bacterium J06598_3]
MEIQQRISHQRIQHIIDSYLLAGNDQTEKALVELNASDKVGNSGVQFDAYLGDLLTQYAPGLIELALVETLVKSWLRVPMEKGVPFLGLAHERLKLWQQESIEGKPLSSILSPGQFSQITGLDAQVAFAALTQPVALSAQSAIE